MAKVEEWPYEVISDKDGKRMFSPMTFTIKYIEPSKDVTAKATGRQYHFPPAVTFEEDPMSEEWSLADWVDGEGGKRVKVDWQGVEVGKDENGNPVLALPEAGSRVSVKLKTSQGTGDRVWRDADVNSLVVLNSNVGSVPVQPAPASAPAPASPPEEDSGFNALDRIPEQQRIAGTALTNVLAPKVWDDAPDGDEWKEFMRKAIKHYTVLQIPLKLRQIIENEELPITDDDITDEDVEAVDW